MYEALRVGMPYIYIYIYTYIRTDFAGYKIRAIRVSHVRYVV